MSNHSDLDSDLPSEPDLSTYDNFQKSYNRTLFPRAYATYSLIFQNFPPMVSDSDQLYVPKTHPSAPVLMQYMGMSKESPLVHSCLLMDECHTRHALKSSVNHPHQTHSATLSSCHSLQLFLASKTLPFVPEPATTSPPALCQSNPYFHYSKTYHATSRNQVPSSLSAQANCCSTSQGPETPTA